MTDEPLHEDRKKPYELSIEIEDRCFSVWKRLQTRRTARVTLLVEFNEHFIIVIDPSNGFWFLPGGGVERNESVEDAARREAHEELGLEIKVNHVLKTFHVTLISEKAKTQLKIPPFIVVHCTPLGKKLKREYAPNRKIVLTEKKNCNTLLYDLEVPRTYECMKPYYHVSREVVQELLFAKQ